MKKLLVAAFVFLVLPFLAAAQTHTFPAEDTNNIFTGTNTFQNSVFTSLVQYVVAGLPSASSNNGLIVVVTDGSTTLDCTSGGGSNRVLCTSTGSAWIPFGSTNGAPFPGPNPWYDVTNAAYGARPQASLISTTAACNGTSTLPVASVTGFQASPGVGKLGDGVVVWGCGPSISMSTPSAPTVTSGINLNPTIPDPEINTVTGSTTYSYKIFGIDQHGGMTAPSAATTITNGLSTQGMVTLSVTSASLTGSTLTLTLPATNSLAEFDRINYRSSNNANLTGDYTIASVSAGGETIVINLDVVTTTSATPVTATGGTLTYADTNKITWTPNNAMWLYGVCGKRPGDSVYHFIGLSLPNTPEHVFAYASSGEYADYGPTMTTPPQLPAYLGDAQCAASTSTPDYLVSTIQSFTTVSAQPAMVLANAASQTSASYPTPTQTLFYNDEPAFAAASNAASASLNGVIFIPEQPGLSYHLTSRWDTTALHQEFTINQQGYVNAYETIATRAHWIGTGTSAFTASQFPACRGGAVVNGYGAWPVVYEPDEVPFWNRIQINDSASGNQGLGLLIDGGANGQEGGFIDCLDVTTGAGVSTDLTGIAIMIRPGPFSFDMQHTSAETGPLNSAGNINTTSTPAIFFDGDPNAANYSVVTWNLLHLFGVSRTFYQRNWSGGTAQNNVIGDYYVQGPINPIVEIGGSQGGISGVNLDISKITGDTSPVAVLAITENANVNVFAHNIYPPAPETGGIAPWITGGAPAGGGGQYNLFSGTFVNTPTLSGVTTMNSQPTYPTATNPGDLVYWNGYIWTNAAGNTSGSAIPQETSTGVLSFTTTPSLGTDNSVAGSLSLSNGSANAHNIFGSGATTSNTINGFATVPTTGHLIDCTVSSTTCLLHDSGVVTANVVNAASPGAGIAHFAGSTQTVTSSAVSLTADVSGVLPIANGGTNQSSASYAVQTDGTTVTWAIGSVLYGNASLLFTVHSGSRTLNLTGMVAGGQYVLKITQDATGGEGLTLGSGCTWKVSGGGAGTVTPSTGANAIDVLAWSYDGANCLANFNKNFN